MFPPPFEAWTFSNLDTHMVRATDADNLEIHVSHPVIQILRNHSELVGCDVGDLQDSDGQVPMSKQAFYHCCSMLRRYFMDI